MSLTSHGLQFVILSAVCYHSLSNYLRPEKEALGHRRHASALNECSATNVMRLYDNRMGTLSLGVYCVTRQDHRKPSRILLKDLEFERLSLPRLPYLSF